MGNLNIENTLKDIELERTKSKRKIECEQKVYQNST